MVHRLRNEERGTRRERIFSDSFLDMKSCPKSSEPPPSLWLASPELAERVSEGGGWGREISTSKTKGGHCEEPKATRQPIWKIGDCCIGFQQPSLPAETPPSLLRSVFHCIVVLDRQVLNTEPPSSAREVGELRRTGREGSVTVKLPKVHCFRQAQIHQTLRSKKKSSAKRQTPNFPLYAIPFLLLLAAGCSSGSDLYPLRVGQQWTYMVSNGFSSRVQQVTVARRVPVALTQGYELQGPMGISRLAWNGGTLYATVLPNTRVYKPIPMLVSGRDKATLKWSGTVEILGKTQNASAEMNQQPETIDFRSSKLETEKSTVTVHLPQETIDLETWYARGVGPVRQEQRTNGKLDVRVELLGGL